MMRPAAALMVLHIHNELSEDQIALRSKCYPRLIIAAGCVMQRMGGRTGRAIRFEVSRLMVIELPHSVIGGAPAVVSRAAVKREVTVAAARILKARTWRFAPSSGPKRLEMRGRALLLTPMHAVRTHQPTDLVEVSAAGGISHFVAYDRSTDRACHLLPSYDVAIRRSGETLRIWVAACDADVERALSLIQREHPKPPRRRGTFLCMALADQGDGTSLVAAANLDGLYHTNMVERDVVARTEFGDDWLDRVRANSLTRKEIVRRLGLVCGTRFAVRRDRQREGLGTTLARHLALVAACWRWPPADCVEVVRWIPGPKLLKTLRGNSDFLTRGGYTPVPSSHWTKGQRHVPNCIPARVGSQAVPAWYYRSVGPLRAEDPIIRSALATLDKARLRAP
jgi:GNAT superfamily N-acetyltransferase